MKKIVIIGGGFAGVWSALAAARLRHLNNKNDEMEIMVINKDLYHGIRPRYYEEDLSYARVPLEKILNPMDIHFKISEVIYIDHIKQLIHIKNTSSELEIIFYDRLILAAGSQLVLPPIPGLKSHGFNIDTYNAAKNLTTHIYSLPKKIVKGRDTFVIVGSGFTGVEIATNLVQRLKKISIGEKNKRIIVIDHNKIANTLGNELQTVVHKVFDHLNIETRTHVKVKYITKDCIELDSGEIIDTQTVIWTAGMQSNLLTKMFSAKLDSFNRLSVDCFLRINDIKNCFAAGDVAAAMTDSTHTALLSCQHAKPQGRIAGYNAVADLLKIPLITYEQKKFVISLDLGPCGALYAEGWDQRIIKQGDAAKKIKMWINQERIYPPMDGNFEGLLNAAAPIFKEIPINSILK